MRPLTSKTLTGIWSTALLPLDENDTIDFRRLAGTLDTVLASGVHGVYTNGTAGEFHTLTEAEYDRLHELVAGSCAEAGMPYQLGAGHPSGHVSLDRIRRAARLSPGAIQVVFPDWLPLGDDEALDALRRMAGAADGVPLVLYNPGYAKTQAGPGLLARIGEEIPEVIGVKVPSVTVAKGLTERFAVFVAGHTLASAHREGAAGSYSNVACLSPAGAVRWFERMTADPAGALALETRIRGFLDAHITPLARQGYCDPALDKTLCAIGGWSDTGTRIRWPHKSVPQDRIPALRAAAEKSIPELLGDPVGG